MFHAHRAQRSRVQKQTFLLTSTGIHAMIVTQDKQTRETLDMGVQKDMIRKYILLISALTVSTFGLVGCNKKPQIEDTSTPQSARDRRVTKDGKLFGDGLTLWGDKRRGRSTETDVGLGINSFLWRGALETLSFAPLLSVDPFGGVILSDWYPLPSNPKERFKISVFITTKDLRSDGIRVAIQHQKIDPKTQQWITIPADSKMASEFEDLILTRARNLKVRNQSQGA